MNPVQRDKARVAAMDKLDEALDDLVPLYDGDRDFEVKVGTIFAVKMREAVERYNSRMLV